MNAELIAARERIESRPMWYDRQLRPIAAYERERLLKSQEDRHVGSTHIGAVWVSTVFLGLDHSMTLSGLPVLFETMIFQLSPEAPPTPAVIDGFDEQYRYTTEPLAIRGHCRIVAALRIGRELAAGGQS